MPRNLAYAGCRTVPLDGSFVNSPPLPRGYDGVVATDGVDPDRMDPVLMESSARCAATKAKYADELFPATRVASPGISFIEFFQMGRGGERKGSIGLTFRR